MSIAFRVQVVSDVEPVHRAVGQATRRRRACLARGLAGLDPAAASGRAA